MSYSSYEPYLVTIWIVFPAPTRAPVCLISKGNDADNMVIRDIRLARSSMPLTFFKMISAALVQVTCCCEAGK